MDSPTRKNEKLIQEDQLEIGSDGIPKEIWDDITKNENFIYYSLMFLNGSVLWAYYTCLSGQFYYVNRFPTSETGLNFEFLTTLVTAWPMVGGHAVQMIFGLDKMLGQKSRVYAGYIIFALMAVGIMAVSAVEWEGSNLKTGANLVLIGFGTIGFANSLTEATLYTLAALFPVEKFTNAVQIGNVWAGVINVTVSAIIRLMVGGIKQEESNEAIAFYLFCSLLIVVCVLSIVLYAKLTNLPSIKFLMERNAESTKEQDLGIHPMKNLSNLLRIFRVIWVPSIAQFLILFVSLTVFPGFGCTGTRNMFQDPNEIYEVTPKWYCSPGIIGSYNFGDFFGRIICTAAVYKMFPMTKSFALSVLRFAYIPLLLMGVSGTSFYVFGSSVGLSLLWNLFINVTIGITNGLLATVTMGTAPRMLPAEDRESGGAIMVLFLFLGIAGGAHFGYLTSANGWLGL